ncbi:unnamed protein product, partial [Ectocarpus sp. 13 AM-2016]
GGWVRNVGTISSFFEKHKNSLVGENGTDLHVAYCVSSQLPKIPLHVTRTRKWRKSARETRTYLDQVLLRRQQSTRQPVPERKKTCHLYTASRSCIERPALQ